MSHKHSNRNMNPFYETAPVVNNHRSMHFTNRCFNESSNMMKDKASKGGVISLETMKKDNMH